MKKRLDDLIDVLSLSTDERSTHHALLSFAEQCGFDNFAYVNVRAGDTEAFSSYPQEWQDIYFANQYQTVDPVITFAKRLLKPFHWSAPLWWSSSPEERKFYAHARQFGIVSGLSMPIPTEFGRTAILTLASKLPDFRFEGAIDDIRAATATAMVHTRLKGADPLIMRRPDVSLSVREKECLGWAARGKSMSLIADILGIKKVTVRYYLDHARRKLEANTTSNAIYLATRRGLI
ncbi:autoinducer binding domain-containing protein [Rhizobium sp. BK418]|uniref:autoinducer binding domain-containing protein n=1 Tax=Rhizobium sp. BK418 TaxID=2512120 RepID=UPI00104381F3|nr:autoinducer binding domain-containing protein [Rhizobium sp. BK418]TCR97873.1 LuxR family transcriptional activator of conjugal transfer of Ti plasmids [Rhizobium sp. BK418]